MAAQDITESLRNNMKRMTHSAVGSLSDPLPRGVAVVSADVYTVAVIPPKSIITGVYLVVDEAATGTTATAAVGIDGSAVTALTAVNLKTVGITAGTSVIAYTGASSSAVTITPTYTAASGGSCKVFVEYIEDASTLMYSAAQ